MAGAILEAKAQGAVGFLDFAPKDDVAYVKLPSLSSTKGKTNRRYGATERREGGKEKEKEKEKEEEGHREGDREGERCLEGRKSDEERKSEGEKERGGRREESDRRREGEREIRKEEGGSWRKILNRFYFPDMVYIQTQAVSIAGEFCRHQLNG